MEQLAKELTHRARHTQDVVTAHSSTTATFSVDLPVISDHSLIKVFANVRSATKPQASNVSGRYWSNVDVEELSQDLLS